ncbi:hypothetical protein [Piscinibacter terrae]|uniref:Uncharacterized protein n=1 Tax=Piscinibacter terrae TaxID=2496871 RepID=A0A3N7JTE6_9BURK|nr:hypothetical protein [Albitalea terrae]RQP22245.1 hypothetical protein DZC73_24970 [Albitalea terrae]
MKRILAITAAAIAAASAQAQTNVGVSVSVVKPGVYGRIDIGNTAPPPVVVAQPVIIAPQPVAVAPAPVYLYVPPGHQKKWSKHCHQYNACGVPVYFVQERWVKERYDHDHDGDRDKHHGHGHGKGNKHDD